MNKVLLLVMILFGINNIFADDIWFMSPEEGMSVTDALVIKISPAYGNKKVRVWIESDMGWERTVWRGSLSTKNNYTITVNTKKFKSGRYELKAKYYIYGDDIDGDVTFWITDSNMSKDGQYFN